MSGSIHHRGLLPKAIIWDGLKFFATAGALLAVLLIGSSNLDYNWQWYRTSRYLFSLNENGFSVGPLLKGLGVTLQISAISLVLASLFGLIAALLRLSNSFVARAFARGYVELIRNTPLLVQIFFVYFVLSPVIGMDRFFSAVLALSLFEGAYASEIFRAGIVSIHKGQWEAAFSLGLNSFKAYRFIVLPQAIRRMLPPLASQTISLVKDSALVSTIAIYDLTMKGQAIIAETYLVFEIWFIVAAIYLTVTLTLSILINMMEKHLAVPTQT
ncbi:amino acid ABC transporter permease [Thermodesulfobacteriota bacterium]